MDFKYKWAAGLITFIKYFAPIIIITCGVLSVQWFQDSKVVKRSPKVKPYFQYVDTVPVEKRNVTPIIYANGQVKPTQIVVSRTQVQGKVKLIPERVIPGGFIKKGDLIAKIEDSISRYDVQEAKAQIQKFQAQYQIEHGKQLAARYEYEMLERELSKENQALVLREPQLVQIEADLARAETNLKRAELNLARTQIVAPFNAQIAARHVSVGSVVKDNTDLVELVATDAFWVEATVSMDDLSRIQTSLYSKQVCEIENVTIYIGESGKRSGCIVSVLPTVEQKIKMARVLIALPDPLALLPANRGQASVLVNDLVQVEIEGERFDNVYQIERDYIQKNHYVWVMNRDSRLERRNLNIAFVGKNYVVVKDGLESTDLLVTDFLTGAVEGTMLKNRTLDTNHKQEIEL